MPSTKLLADVVSAWGACGEHLSTTDLRGRSSETPNSNTRKRGVNRALLERAIEGEVIPRLMLAHRLRADEQPADAFRAISPGMDDVSEFVRILLEHDSSVALGFAQTLLNGGVSIESLYLDLLAPAARLLGEMWKADLCDFADVSIGLSRLHQLTHEISPSGEADELPMMTDRKILLVPAFGEQHTFGIMVVEEFFRRAGWECCTAMPQTGSEIANLVKRDHFDVVGISLSSEHLFNCIAPMIQSVRKSTKNKSLTVAVGGGVFAEHPEYVSRVGADFAAVDGRQAVLQLRTIFDTDTARIR